MSPPPDPLSPSLRATRLTFSVLSRMAPGPAARLAEWVFCRPPQPRPRPGEGAFLATGRRFTLSHGSGRLVGWEWGAGPTIVLVHGWGSRAGRFRALAPVLVAAGYRVVAYDGPAHGQSDGWRASMPEFADALERIARWAGPVHGLVGHSLGGAAIALAMLRGVEAGSAVLLAPAGDATSFTDRFAETVGLSAAVRERMKRNLEQRFGLDWTELDLPQRVGAMTRPLLVIHDADDADVPWEHGAAIARAWPGASLVTTRGLGHRQILSEPAVVARTVAFMGGESGPPA